MEAMRRLLAVSDFYPVAGNGMPGRHAAFPSLPALSELLRLGVSREIHADWRAGLAADLGAGALGRMAPASVAALAVNAIAPGSPVCMATPVHMVAGMASVHLHPAGLLRLDADEAADLQRGFEREFGNDSQRLHVSGSGLLLESALASAAGAPDPAQLLGSPLEAERHSSAARQELRRLGVEVEMWLAGWQCNRERERRGALPVSALWFWGGGVVNHGDLGSATLQSGARQWIEAHGDDPWLSGCWQRLAGKSLLPAAADWNAISTRSALVLVSAIHGFPELESGWFEPALRDLRARKVSGLTLRIGGRSWEVGTGLRRWWRRSRPWWEVLAA
jgi:hypothetical protein